MRSSVRRGLEKLNESLGSERGIALPTAVMMVMIVGMLAVALVATSTTGSRQSTRDRSVKRALAAADAGLQVAVYRMNQVRHAENECVAVASDGSLEVRSVGADGWCTMEAEGLGDSASYTYRVSQAINVRQNGQNLVQRKVVATGCVLPGATPQNCLAQNGVKRRTLTVVGSPVGSIFGSRGVLSDKTVRVEENGKIISDVASNEDVIIDNNGEICGNVTYGPPPARFQRAPNAIWRCPNTTATRASSRFLLNPVDGTSARTNNNNRRIGVEDVKTGSVSWDPNTRDLKLDNFSTLTLTGDVYSFCHLQVSNGAELIIASRAAGRPPLRIFIDKPENCNSSIQDRGSVTVDNGASLTNLNSGAATLQMYVVGSPSISTFVRFENNAGTSQNPSGSQRMIVYAPYSTVSVLNNGNFIGAVAAKQVSVKNNGRITFDPNSQEVGDPNTIPLYRRQSWTECKPRNSGSAPDSNC